MRRWHEQHPEDWRTTRRLLKERYTQAGGAMRDRNGYDLMTGSTIAALLYGRGDLAETLRLAFNFGWDADNSAATAGAVVGTVVGYRSMMSRGWRIVDRYRNTTREGMADDETITSFADRLIELAETVIVEQGGERVRVRGRPVYRIRSEPAANVYPPVRPGDGEGPDTGGPAGFHRVLDPEPRSAGPGPRSVPRHLSRSRGRGRRRVSRRLAEGRRDSQGLSPGSREPLR
jgi:hypothetical protein